MGLQEEAAESHTSMIDMRRCGMSDEYMSLQGMETIAPRMKLLNRTFVGKEADGG